ncbi:HNH endonuclease [Peribacillus sp. SCS-155]|uniref:HNH endonuclease n=1 Tax=Peribacillus sedimenti TaxID=3115297 RepID=UPI003906936A
MVFQPNIKIGQILNNNQIAEVFKCSTQGGMRRSHATNTLVIISDHTKLYEDKWIGKLFHYTGMGKKGDQSLSFAQNKTLAESNNNDVAVHLFEVLRPTEYVYMGQVELVGEPYQDEQFDEDKILRNVWIFPLELVSGKKPLRLPKRLIDSKEEAREKLAQKLSDEELALRAKHASKKATSRTVTTNNFERNPFVTEYAKRWSKGICQLCERPAPFMNKKGEPHLHCHHIIWLSKGGEDSIYNAIAVCSNCHDKLHILDLESDVLKLRQKVEQHHLLKI